ncbi:MAG: 3-phosphoshikimate 1-carboxyvinyltransferase [Methanoregulaceae archaeon]|nr:3-phosphoshikimate 1-carboxyvinyltransferase [Methanoregulaceae archaeon]
MDIRLRKTETINIRVYAPPSKSYTHRALVAGALAEGTSRLERPLKSTDTSTTAAGLELMGIPIDREGDQIVIQGLGGELKCRKFSDIPAGDSGTSFRLLTSVALLCRCPVIMTGSPRMKERPVKGLVSALNQIGGKIHYLENTGFPPLLIDGTLVGGKTRVESKVSSQFASSILLSAPYAESAVELEISPDAVSRSYLDVTCDIMTAFGAQVSRQGYERFTVDPGHRYTARSYRVEGDYSSASYFFAMAAVCGGRAVVDNLVPGSVQGDRAFLDALATMGCRVSTSGTTVTVESNGSLTGIEIDMSGSPDSVQTLCMVAACARSPSRLTGISHLKYKESNRILAIMKILQSLGGNIVTESDGTIVIRPTPLHGGIIHAENDHRTAMSAAVLGLAIGDIIIIGAECVSKSFPEFWKILHEAGLI